VRAVYSNPILYAAGFGGENTSISWWDAVDYIGVNAYYELHDDVQTVPTVEALEAAWTWPKQQLAELSADYGKPIIFTEIGYRSHQGCSVHPWDDVTVSELSMEEQARAYAAAFRQVFSAPWLHGMFWWLWPVDRFVSGDCDDSYSPHLKSAEDVLRAWYGASPMPSSTLVREPDYNVTMDIVSEGLAPDWYNWSWDTLSLNMAATDPVFTGTLSMAAQLNPWGAVSLGHTALSHSPYYWLEFQILGGGDPDQHLLVYLNTSDNRQQDMVPVDSCHFMEGGKIVTDTWRLVRIPLSELKHSGIRSPRSPSGIRTAPAPHSGWTTYVSSAPNHPRSSCTYQR
jgi:hypothetical protein